MLELAKKQGKATGLITDTRVTHATPAGFAAHVAHRSSEYEIAEQMIEGKADVVMGGGLRHFLPAEVNNQNSTAYK